MYSYRIDNIANIELIEAGNAYLSYFCRIGEPEKGDAWCDRFYEAYLREAQHRPMERCRTARVQLGPAYSSKKSLSMAFSS